jgi:hypothetical protein
MTYFGLETMDLAEKDLRRAAEIDPAHFSHPSISLTTIRRILPMRLLSATLCTTVAAALLASCSGTGSSPSNSVMPGNVGNASRVSQSGHHHAMPQVNLPKAVQALHHDGRLRGKKAPAAALRGSWASGFFGFAVEGYPKNNSTNGPPTCSLANAGSVNGFGTDTKGDVIVPVAFSGVQVWAPGCGALLGTIDTSNIGSQAADAAAIDAVNGTIIVGFVGAAATCTLSSLSCTPLTGNGIAGFTSVAMTKAGDCYAQSDSTSGPIGLWYWPGCTGTANMIGPSQGFNQPGFFPGSLDIDNKGNLVVINQENNLSEVDGNSTVYTGCDSGSCTVIAGPTSLSPIGSGVDQDYCHLGRQNERLICGDASFSQVDVFTYLPSREPTYLYSFNNGVTSVDVEAAAYTPSSQK